ncbi:MAG: hypothetical protein ACYC3P_07690 [Bellilinea sp.]
MDCFIPLRSVNDNKLFQFCRSAALDMRQDGRHTVQALRGQYALGPCAGKNRPGSPEPAQARWQGIAIRHAPSPFSIGAPTRLPHSVHEPA